MKKILLLSSALFALMMQAQEQPVQDSVKAWSVIGQKH
jgi:hypothetical protein